VSRTFSKQVKRKALERSGLRCEAVGPLYGLPEGVRCNANLGVGFDFDHVNLWANSRDSGLDNVAVVCRVCHKHKTTNHDTPKAAKTVRQRDKHYGIRATRNPLPGSKASKWKRRMDGSIVER
jgi:hypothetical protein